jgi:hypothetical protein
MSSWTTNEEFPAQLEAWRQTTLQGVHPQLFINADETTRREIVREIYEFLHAQQLVAMSNQLQQIGDNVKQLTEKPQDRKDGNFLRYSFALVLGCAVGAAAMFFWKSYENNP